MTTENLELIANEIATNLDKRAGIINSSAAKYFRKGDVLSHRKFYIDFVMNGKHVKTVLANAEFSNKLAKDYIAIRDLIGCMFLEFIHRPEANVCLN